MVINKEGSWPWAAGAEGSSPLGVEAPKCKFYALLMTLGLATPPSIHPVLPPKWGVSTRKNPTSSQKGKRRKKKVSDSAMNSWTNHVSFWKWNQGEEGPCVWITFKKFSLKRMMQGKRLHRERRREGDRERGGKRIGGAWHFYTEPGNEIGWKGAPRSHIPHLAQRPKSLGQPVNNWNFFPVLKPQNENNQLPLLFHQLLQRLYFQCCFCLIWGKKSIEIWK